MVVAAVVVSGLLLFSSCRSQYYLPGRNGRHRGAAKGCGCPSYAFRGEKTGENPGNHFSAVYRWVENDDLSGILSSAEGVDTDHEVQPDHI